MHTPHDGARKALLVGLLLTLLFVAIEAVTGYLAGSLALVSDAGHMLADSAGLFLALAAATIARRPADSRRTFGYARAEVLAVPVHVTLLCLIAGYIVFEAIRRLGSSSPELDTAPVVAVGVAGLAVNLLVLRILHGHAHDNLNVRGATLEAMADALGSVAVILSATAIALGAWRGLDALVALAIAALIVPRALSLLRHAGSILMESAPRGLDPDSIAAAATEVRGVLALHDVHVWSIAPSFPALSAHVELADAGCTEHVLTDLATLFRDRFGIGHVTLQPETPALHEAMECCMSPDAGRIELAAHTHEITPR
ncbi:MAG: cation diffusion facilitator family transporter [Chloroflexi bacterium]|nr:cation diffusion facilitator family transporter [Chloroflexota bacterium]